MSRTLIALVLTSMSAAALAAPVEALVIQQKTDSLTYCGSLVQIEAADDAALIGRRLYMADGRLVDGHDCVTTSEPGDRLTGEVVLATNGRQIFVPTTAADE